MNWIRRALVLALVPPIVLCSTAILFLLLAARALTAGMTKP